MSHNVLELTTLSDNIQPKKIWETPSTYQVGYQLVTTVEKANEVVANPEVSKIYTLKYSHVSINGKIHPLDRIEAYKINKCKCHIGKVKLVFKCEYRGVVHDA